MNEWRATVRARLAEVASRPGEDVPLAEGGLLIAAEEYPGLDIAQYLTRIDILAEQIRDEIRGAVDPRAAGTALTTFLYERERFRGNADDYYDPRNSFLNEVLDRRTGLPITLSILYIEVGARLGLNVRGIGLPGHFLVKLEAAGTYLDPFTGRVDLSESDCAARVRSIHGDSVSLDASMFAPQSNRQTLTRVLTNLRTIYGSSGDLPRARGALDRLVLLNPGAGHLYRDRAEVLAALGEYRLALRDVEQARQLQPSTRRSRRFRGWRRFVREMAARMN